MIVDTSSIVAICRNEPRARECLIALEEAGRLAMSAATYVELVVVSIRSREPLFQRAIAELLNQFAIEQIPFTASQATIAEGAFRLYGQGQQHPAKLNFGDCFSYALAKERNEPLLFVGDDFTHTDLRSALA